MGLSKCRSKTLLFISKVTQLLLVKEVKRVLKDPDALGGKEQINWWKKCKRGRSETETKKKKERKRKDRRGEEEMAARDG